MGSELHNPKEIEACFEYYYKLGHGRTVLAVTKKFGIDFDAANEWKNLYAWDEKVKDRDADIYSATERLYAEKSRGIRNRLVAQVGNLLDEVEGCSLGLPFRIKDVDDLRKLAQAYKLLVEANTLALTKGQDMLDENSIMSWADLIQTFSNKPTEEFHEDEFKDI